MRPNQVDSGDTPPAEPAFEAQTDPISGRNSLMGHRKELTIFELPLQSIQSSI